MMMIVIFLFLLILALSPSQAIGSDKCLQSSYRFPADSVPLDREGESLPLCGAFLHNTCCDADYARGLLMRYKLDEAGLVSERCKQMTAMRTCFVCHPDVGTGKITKVCKSFCDEWFDACANEFYESSGPTGGNISPCSANSLLCSKLGDIVSNGIAFCENSGLKVAIESTRRSDGDDDEEDGEGKEDEMEKKCFDGTAPKSKGPKSVRSNQEQKNNNSRNGISVKQLWNNYVAMLLANFPSSTHKYIRRMDKFVKSSIEALDHAGEQIGSFAVWIIGLFFSLSLVLFVFILGSQSSRR